MINFRCTCNKLLVEQEAISQLSIRCGKCSKTFMYYNGDYREYEVAEVIENFTKKTPRGYKAVGLVNTLKIKRRK